VALPGERLSKAAGGLSEADLAAAEVFTIDDLEPTGGSDDATVDDAESADGGRRRRRRGGRGRGRGRGRDEVAAERAPAEAGAVEELDVSDEDEEPSVPRSPRPTTPFGSVWDSQLGTPVTPSVAGLGPIADDEDFDEPEIPEYLIAEQRRGAARGGGRGPAGRGPRGGRSAYQSAIERERYGRGGGGGINRYPDVSGRGRTSAPRDDRTRDRSRDDRPRPVPRSSSEPWSEVPPELEAMLRAQVAQKPASPSTDTPTTPDVTTAPETEGTAPKRRTTRKPATAKAAASAETGTAAPKPRSTRKPATAKSATTKAAASGTDAKTDTDGETAAPKPRSTRKTGTAKTAAPDTDAAKAAPKRRTTRKPATATAAAAETEPA
jgi:hypothetical protein